MELRLLHGIAYSQPWFAQWNYKIHHGSYGVTLQTYQTTLSSLQSLPLPLLLSHLPSPDLSLLLPKYQSISNSIQQPLLTLSDLIRLMLHLAHHLPRTSPTTSFLSDPTCRWSVKRVDTAAQVIVAALKRLGPKWVTRQDVRDAARAYVGDTGLLDYVLKSLGNRVVGNHVVRRLVNPVTKVLEYSLQDVGTLVPHRLCITKAQVVDDLNYLCKHVLRGLNPVKSILDAKHLVKSYHEGLNLPSLSEKGVMCRIKVSNELKEEISEMVKLEGGEGTVGELKRKARRKLKESYFGLRRFEVVEIEGVEAEDDEVFEGDTAVVVGYFVGGAGEEEIYEGCDKVVDCYCGGRWEDGEKMVCCDICEVWKHSKCAGIGDDEEVPQLFLCRQCDSNIVTLPSILY